MGNLDFDYGQQSDTDVALDESAEQFTGKRDEWLKFTKGMTIRASFLFFHRGDANAVARARVQAKKDGRDLSTADLQAVGRKYIESVAARLNKSVDQLDVLDLLDTTDAKFKQFMYHYQQGLGYLTSKLDASGRTKEGPEADKVWKSLEEPKQGFSTLLLVYPTNPRGEITESEKQRLATDWRLIPWRFSKKTFEDIWKQNIGLRENGMSLATQDVKIECKEAQYQQVAVSFVGPAIWQKNEKFKRVVLEAAMPMYDRLLPFREMTTQQLREKLNLAGPAAGGDVSMGGVGGDFNDLLTQV